MNRPPTLLRWLAFAALADWMIARTFTRAVIFMPKPPVMLAVYRGLSLVGQLAFTLAGLLGILALGCIAVRHLRAHGWGLSGILFALLALNVMGLVVPPSGWAAVGFHALVLAAVTALGLRGWLATAGAADRAAVVLPTLALALGSLYQLTQSGSAAGAWPDPAPMAMALFNYGEAFAVVTPVGLWLAARRTEASSFTDTESEPRRREDRQGSRRESLAKSWRPWRLCGSGLSSSSRAAGIALAAIPALAFAAMRLADPALTGVLSIWSTGMTLFLPWPVYAIGLWLAGAGVIRAWRGGDSRGWAMVLFMACGVAPPLASQLFFGLCGLWLLTAGARPMPNGIQRQDARAPSRNPIFVFLASLRLGIERNQGIAQATLHKERR